MVVRVTLQRIPGVYYTAWYELHRLGSTPGSAGGNPNKPGSKPPAGMDRRLRANLVECARAISDATWHLGHHELPTLAWRPTSFVHKRKLTVNLGRPWRQPVSRVTCLSCDALWEGEHTQHGDSCRGQPIELVTLWIADRWSPSPDDLAILIPHPNQIANVCSRLDGNLGLLETRGVTDSGDDPDPHVQACVRSVKRARGALHDVWPVGRDSTGHLCANQPCRNYPRTGGRECGTCANHRSKWKKPRPIEPEDGRDVRRAG